MITATAAIEPLYYFLQMAFHGKTERMKEIAFSHSVAAKVFEDLARAGSLSIKEVMTMPESEMRALYELMTQYVMFLTMSPDLSFPRDFLLGSSKTQIGKPWLNYFVERRFPFPQRLPQ